MKILPDLRTHPAHDFSFLTNSRENSRSLGKAIIFFLT